MYIIYIILIIYIIYNVYNLSISLVQRSKNSSSTEQTHVCYDLIVSCQLLVVRIAPAQGCLVGANRHVLRPYCYLLFVICYDCARQCEPLLKEKMFHGDSLFNRNRRPFALQSTRDSTAIADRLHCNRPPDFVNASPEFTCQPRRG